MKTFLKSNIYSVVGFLLVGLFLTVNLATLPQYGITWDELYQHGIGEAAINYIKTGQVGDIKFLPFDHMYYGPAFEVVSHYFAKVAVYFFHLNYIDSHHVLIVLISALGALTLFLFAKKLFGRHVAVFSLLFFIFFPRFIGHAHYNSKDIPLMVFSLLVISSLYFALESKNYPWAILAGIFMGMNLSVRVNALLVLLIFFIPYIIYLFFGLKIQKQEKWGIYLIKDFIIVLLFLGATALVTFATWPMLWHQPSLFFESIGYFLKHSWPGKVLYFGQIYTGSGLPWHYAPLYLLIVTPFVALLFFAFGFVEAIKKILKKSDLWKYLLIIFWLLIPLLVAMKPVVVRYDGIRHFFIILPALAIIAGIGANWVWVKIKNLICLAVGPSSSRMCEVSIIIFTAAILFSLSSEILKIHPFEGSYFNELLRLAIPKNIENYFDIEYWGVTYKQGADWLNKSSKFNSKICVPFAGHLLSVYQLRRDISLNCNDKELDYYMFFQRTSALVPEQVSEIKASFAPVFEIKRFDSILLSIYQKK